MVMRFMRSFGGKRVTIDQRGKTIPTLTLRDEELKDGKDYSIEELDNEEITEIVFEWMDNQHVYFQK